MTCPICNTTLSCHGDFLFCDTPGCEIFPGVDNIEVESVKMQIDHGVEPRVGSLFWLGQGYLVLTPNVIGYNVATVESNGEQ